MAIRETLLLDLGQALDQINDLERELDALFQPIVIPVEVESAGELAQLQRDIRQVDNDDIDIDVDVGELSDAEREMAELQAELAEAVDDARDFERAIDRAGNEAESVGRQGSQAFGNLGTSLRTLAISAAGVIGLREIGEFFRESIDAASDLEESTSKASVVFGDFFDDIQDFASTAPAALGLANAEALEFTGTFGNLFTALGLSQQAAADLSPEIVNLGADLASFNNIEVTDALEKLRAGLVGEAEPLRALGVNINAATTEAKAFELGLGGLNGELTDAAKVQARYALILEQTGNAQGDFARTADGIANRQRTLSANFQNLQADIGEALLPAFESLVAAAEDILPALSDLAPALGDVAGGFIATLEPVLALLGPLAELASLYGELQRSNEALGASDNAAVSFFGEINNVLATGALGTAIEKFDEFRFSLRTGFNFDNVTRGAEEFYEALRDGRDPAREFTDVLQTISERGRVSAEILGIFTENLELTGAEAARIRILAREGFFGDLSDEELRTINDEMDRFIDVADRFQGRRTAQGFESITQALDPLDDALTDSFTALDQNFNLISEFGARRANFDGILDSLSELAPALDEVGEALRDSEGEIETDFSNFLATLQDQLSENIEFNALIAQLREIAPNLADELARNLRPGPEANALIADAIANPLESAEAEQAIADAATANAQLYAADFGADVQEFIEAFDPIEFPIQIVADTSTFSVDIGSLGSIQIPVGFGDPVAPSGGVTQVFPAGVPPTPDLERARQAAQAITSRS